MEVIFQNAKNGELTAQINNLYLHSSYNPIKEAERFVSSINVSYSPTLIIILEPAISYIIPFLKNRFINSKIAIIRYVPDFNKFNNGADYVFNYYEHKNDFENYLFNSLGEEKIFGALILQWLPSSKIFTEIESNILNDIKASMEKSKTLLVTREFFEKKWLLNSCNFVKYINHPVTIKNNIDIPIVIISSGPSLNCSIDVIKKYRDKIFIICLSSAIKVCIFNNIIPDICVSTDGGFWAGQHLKVLTKLFNMPLALPLEGYCEKSILENNLIMPLLYNDGISKEIAIQSELPTVPAERNGTVSGTALILALSLTSNDIFFCGLDMAGQKGFQHCQPNELELNNSLNDNKIKSKEQRAAMSEYSKGVLSIYKDWFEYLNLANRKVYRIIEKKYKKNTLGQIKDINHADFEICLNNSKNINSKSYFKELNWNKDTKKLFNYLKEKSKTEEWKKNIFPLSMSSLSHNPENTDITNRLEKEQLRLMTKIENILNE